MKTTKSSLTVALGLAICAALGTTAMGVTWNVPDDFVTIQLAIDSLSVLDGHTILVAPGSHAGALVTKAVEIKGDGGAVINSGPAHSSGRIQGFRIMAGGSGATISHLGFQVDLPVMNGEGANDVTVEYCTMASPIQGVTNWRGNGWNISHNVIDGLRTRNGGGIGIFIGCWNGGTANNNLMAHNKITGQIVVSEGDCGDYDGPGICLMSDRRWGRAGGVVSGNSILKNNVSLSSTNAGLVEAVGIELTDMGLEQSLGADLKDNKVGFNDVRGVTGTPIALNPAGVEDNNSISRNLGDDPNNRGHGLHPKVLFE